MPWGAMGCCGAAMGLLWGAVGRCGTLWVAMGLLWGTVGRCGALWGRGGAHAAEEEMRNGEMGPLCSALSAATPPHCCLHGGH